MKQKYWPKLVLVLAVLSTLFVVWVQMRQGEEEVWKPSRLGQLAIRLEGKYRRSLEKNGYSLHYRAKEPNVIIIKSEYYPNTDVQMIYNILHEAETFIKKLAVDEFALHDVRVETELQRVEREKKAEEFNISF